jgi:CHAD domain-containing protein
LKAYVNRQALVLLRRLAVQIGEAKQQGTADSVHDLRIGIRRLSECLRTFETFFPGDEAGRLRRELKTMMDLAGEVRNRDVAHALFVKGGARGDKLMARLAEEHGKASAALAAKLKDWRSEDFPRRCRSELKL